MKNLFQRRCIGVRAATGSAHGQPMKLGLCVVYLLKDDAGPLLQLHLDRITRHTRVPFTLYGAPLRLQPRFREHLLQHPRVTLVEIPPLTEPNVSREHAYHLDALVQAALADGATHLCVLHPDSFPIRDGWAEELAACIHGKGIGAGILRAENGDRILPQPAGFLFSRAFQEACQPRFFAPPSVAGTADYQRFEARYLREKDSGFGYAYAIHRHGLRWKRLLRSNRYNDHYLMAGVYGDLLFHLGAAARTERRFRGDYCGAGASWRMHGGRALEKAGRWLPEALRARLPDRTRLLEEAEAANHACFDRIYHRLLDDPDRYLELLRTGF